MAVPTNTEGRPRDSTTMQRGDEGKDGFSWLVAAQVARLLAIACLGLSAAGDRGRALQHIYIALETSWNELELFSLPLQSHPIVSF